MAMIMDIHCSMCGKIRQITVGAGRLKPTVCGTCENLENDRKRREHFKGLDGLTVEERLRKIEYWIYNYKPPINPMEIRY